MQKHLLTVRFYIMTPQRITSFNVSTQHFSHLVESDGSVLPINVIPVTSRKPLRSRLWNEQKTQPSYVHPPQTFPVFILIVVPSISELINNLNSILPSTNFTWWRYTKHLSLLVNLWLISWTILSTKRSKVSFSTTFLHTLQWFLRYFLDRTSLSSAGHTLALTRWVLRVLAVRKETKGVGKEKVFSHSLI